MVNLLNTLIPLYMYPSGCTVQNYNTNACAWGPFFRGIEANTGYIHTVVVNPQNGPGNLYSYPDDSWKAVISKLNSISNARTIGYIDSWSDATNEANPLRPKILPSTYRPQIQTYVNWANYSGGLDLHVDGLFVDDFVGNTPAKLQYYQQYANDIKSIFPATYKVGGVGTTYNYEKWITVNPGQPIACDFYSNVSSVVTFEGFYRDVAGANFKDAAYNACPRVKQDIIIHDFPGSATDQQQVCDDFGETYRVGNLYITNQTQIDSQDINPYDKVPGLWGYFASSITATNSWISAHPQWYSP